jgi:hypothetical protein
VFADTRKVGGFAPQKARKVWCGGQKYRSVGGVNICARPPQKRAIFEKNLRNFWKKPAQFLAPLLLFMPIISSY